jgi:metallo-beta-lactamase class B
LNRLRLKFSQREWLTPPGLFVDFMRGVRAEVAASKPSAAIEWLGNARSSMSRLFHHAFLVAMLLGLALPSSAQDTGRKLSAATDGERPATANPGTQKFAGPIKLFDNLYYIGTDFVSAYLLVTSEGLIMIDSLYEGYTTEALAAIRGLGLDPADIRYLLVTHGHQDHAGGIEEVRKVFGATVAMTAADWSIAGLEPELVYEDGDELTLGDTRIRFYVTPGHTPGVLSMQFTVKDGSGRHEAFLFGGHNVTSSNAEDFRAMIDSVQRLQASLPAIEVNLTSHPWAALIFQRTELLANRKPGEPHPFVDGADFDAFLAERLQSSQQRLAEITAGR